MLSNYNRFKTIHLSTEERAVASSDYDSTYDSTYETNHSDSSDFAQNEEEGEGGKKSAEGRDYLAGGIVLHPLLPSQQVGREPLRRPSPNGVLSFFPLL